MHDALIAAISTHNIRVRQLFLEPLCLPLKLDNTLAAN